MRVHISADLSDLHSDGCSGGESPRNKAGLFDYAGESTVAEDYRAFIGEFLKGVEENNGSESNV